MKRKFWNWVRNENDESRTLFLNGEISDETWLSLIHISDHYNDTRYHGLNLHATFTKGTVEFRLFNSTTHAGEIKAYIQFCLAVSHQALTQKKASARRTVTDNEKYAFRCWMLRLGLNGDEFKTCRLHFLKHLEGNSAWRHAA